MNETVIAVFGEMIPLAIGLGTAVVLPITVVWLVMKKKRNDTNRRAEVMLAAIEKNTSVGNMEELLKQMTPPQPTVREKRQKKMHNYLMFGVALTIIGAAIMLTMLIKAINDGVIERYFISNFCFTGVPCLAFGIGMLMAYRSMKKTLAADKEEAKAN